MVDTAKPTPPGAGAKKKGLTANQKTLAGIVAGVIVAVVPSIFGYLQARDEIQAKYLKSNAETEAGYQALKKSVEELQAEARTQHDKVVVLQAHVEFLEKRLERLDSSGRPTSPTPSPEPSAIAPPPLEPPKPAPKLKSPPRDIDDALLRDQ